MSSRFSDLVSSPLGDGYQVLRKPFTYRSRMGIIGAEAGFVWDEDSICRCLGLLYAWLKGRTIKGALVHDKIYRDGRIQGKQITRRQADLIFLDAMKHEGVAWRHRWAIYVGTVAGAWVAWNKHRRADA